jgi:uncharacterized protein
MSIVKRIFELQQIDAALLSTHQQLDDIKKHIEHNDVFEQARETFETTRQMLTDLEKQYKELDADADELRKSISGIDDKLYGGKVKNPKELVGYEQEAGLLKAKLRKMDDSLLEMMERIESGKGNVGKLKQALHDAEAAWNKEKVVLQQKAGEITAQLNELETKRKDILSEVDGGSLSLYEGIKGRRAQAVVRVEQGRCMGCRVSLSMSELQRVRGSSIVQCSNCGRILYLS